MVKCCGDTCACKLTSGLDSDARDGLQITGSGSLVDPFVIKLRGLKGAVGTDVTITVTYDPVLGYTLTPSFSATSKLDNLGDVNTPAPTNGQVIGWDSATSKWTARAAPTAAPGAVQIGNGLAGDGSVGSPLAAKIDPGTDRGLQSITAGLGLTDLTRNKIVLHYANAAARTASTLVPLVNSLSVLDTAAGEVDYWDGSAWKPLNIYKKVIQTTQVLSLSGAYAGGQVQLLTKLISATTDANGVFGLLLAADLTGLAGVLSYHYQPTGATGHHCQGNVVGSEVYGTAYDLATGAKKTGTAVTGVLTAHVY